MKRYLRWAGLLTALMLLLVLRTGQVAAAATSSGQAIALLNAQRAANGIPAGISELSDWDAACESHDNWMYLNGVLQHGEVPGTPGYTDAGAAIGQVSVLAQGDWVPSSTYPWGAQSPWEDAPIHLMDTLEPWLMFTGFADYEGYACEVTQTAPLPTGDQVVARSPATPELLTYPGDATHFIPPSEVAREAPATPGEAVGIPAGTQTGPYLLVFAWGRPPGRITSASLTGPDGPVNIVTADNETSGSGNLAGIGMDMPPGGVIIPRLPLKPDTTYAASVVFTPVNPFPQYPPQFPGEYDPLAVTWEFTTGNAPTPGVGGGTMPAPPSLLGFTQSAAIWRAADKRAQTSSKRKPPVGTTFAFTLNERARLTLTFTPRFAGRRVHGQCVHPTPRNKSKPRCKIVARTLAFTGHQGLNRVRFYGRLTNGEQLKPGQYSATITATTTTSERTHSAPLIFTIVR